MHYSYCEETRHVAASREAGYGIFENKADSKGYERV